MTLPLNKFYSPNDFPDLAPELEIVLQHWDKGQYENRKWEYAMALHTLRTWEEMGSVIIPRLSRRLVDVGGAGSPFLSMAGNWHTTVVDPKVNIDLADYMTTRPCLADAVVCLSVLEHVDDLDRFVYHLSCLVAPGGLLFLTVDACDTHEPGWPADTYHFHWDRKRIFSDLRLRLLRQQFAARDFETFGEVDRLWNGPIENWGYSIASVAMVKKI